ncbi:MAG: ornithine cyclodeaminase [Candidatus Marinimicrobia bacterium]|nr:ornithine cyclodeaminase [Candidatus Neomarinimicrobiota bacterium]|tara:strand:+ start:4395 stop:5378 length:984 start_codon:yes stop_codon:yes gene_type:complete
MSLLILNRQEVRELLPMRDCMDVLAAAFRAYSSGESVQPLRTMMKVPETDDILASMPGYDGASESMAVKLITVFDDAAETVLDSHQGLVVLFSSDHGNPLAIMDAIEITAIRTAAASGVATEALAKEDASALAILGAGVQARSHFDAMTEARDIKTVRIWNRSRNGAEALAAELPPQGSVDVTVANTVQSAVSGADLICTVTAAAEPVLKGEWIQPSVHVNAVGSSTPSKRELDTDAIVRSRLFVDSRESAVNEAGDFLIPKSEGAVGDDHIVGEIGEVLSGKAPGRQSRDEITLFKSLGMAVEDVAAAHLIYERAKAEDRGVWIEM